MARFYPTGGSGAGTGSDECTATKGDVLKGKTAVTSDSDDEAAAGTLELTGNAGAANVLAGKTFYSTDAKSKQSGTMPNVAAIDPAKSTSMSGGNLYVRMTNGAHVQNASSGYPEVSVPAQTKTATPGASAVTVSPDANKVLEKVTVNAVSGLSAGNIKNGATVGGVKGTYKGLGNASQGQVLAGKTFSTASLSNATGTMTDHTAKPSKIQNRRLANGRFEVAVDAGYYKCLWADGSYEYMELSEVASTAGLTAAKLWPGNTVLGITSNKSTMAGKTITPSTSQQTVSCNGKAMTGNIVVNAIPSNYVNINSNPTVFKDGSFGILGTAKRVVKNTTGKYTGYEQVSISNGEILISSSETNADRLWAFQKMFKRGDFKKVTYTFQKSSNAFDSLYFGLVLYRNSGEYSFLLSDYLTGGSYDNNVEYERTITIEDSLGSNREDVTHIGVGINAVWTKSTAAPNARFNNIYLHN